MTKITKIDEARVHFFYEAYGMIKADTSENCQKKMMSIDACAFSPCLKELQQQVLRSMYISSIWMNADKSKPTDLNLYEYGWCLENDQISCKWYEGDEMPATVFDIVAKRNNGGTNFFIAL